MTFPSVNRYSDLVKGIVGGSYYENLGIVVPYRGSLPTILRLETGTPNTEFGVYISSSWSGTEITDANGNVVLSRTLPLGENIITLTNRDTGQAYSSYVTVRDWAIWLTAYAEALEIIDSNIFQVYDDLSIYTASLEALETIYGEPIQVYADLGQSQDAYRYQLQELRAAYRNFGSTYKGISDVVSTFTQVPPFGYARRMWGPNWVLDQSMLKNSNFVRTSVVTSTTNITGVSVVSVESDVVSNPVAPHELQFDAANKTLLWVPEGVAGTAKSAENGLLFLPGPSPQPAYILGRAVTPSYSINAGYNNHLYLNIDGKGYLDVTLTTGVPMPGVSDIVKDINNATAGDKRYGPSLFAYTYNSKVLIISTDSVEVCNGPMNCAGEIFGVTRGSIQVGPSEPIVGASILEIQASTLPIMGTCYLEHTYDDTLTPPHMLRWKSVTGSYNTYTTISDSGVFEVTDSLGAVCLVHCYPDLLPTQVGSPLVTIAPFSIGYSKIVKADDQTQGIWVQVTEDDLPITNQTDVVTVYDDYTDGYVETPDYWFVNPVDVTTYSEFVPSQISTSKSDPLNPTSSFAYHLVDGSAATQMTLIGHAESFPLNKDLPKGSNYPQLNPNGLYDYENYTMKFSGWFRSSGANPSTVTLSVSFDGGDTWVNGTATAIASDTDGRGLEQPSYVEFETVISPSIKYQESTPLTWEDSGVLVKVTVNKAAGAIDVLMDCLDIQVKFISSAYLGNATVSILVSSCGYGPQLP
jgi:hypothetical protein